ncbi:unnamed protein product [Trichobilharzia regenti]|nr:unnamed protein product [Trichobilharzia regenti]
MIYVVIHNHLFVEYQLIVQEMRIRINLFLTVEPH